MLIKRQKKIVGKKNLQFTIECKNQIPLSRGIGSSAAAIVGGLLGANYFLGNSMTIYDLFKIAEKHKVHLLFEAAVAGGIPEKWTAALQFL